MYHLPYLHADRGTSTSIATTWKAWGKIHPPAHIPIPKVILGSISQISMGGGHELEEARQKYQNKDSQSWCVPFFFFCNTSNTMQLMTRIHDVVCGDG